MNPNRTGGATSSAAITSKRTAHFRWFLVFVCFFYCFTCGRAYSTIDLNGNGMSDVWESIYGSGLDPNADLNGTGMTNLQKSIAGLSPYISSPLFITSVTNGTGSNLLLNWPSVLGKQYQIQGTASLTSGSWADIGGALAGTGTTMTSTVSRSGSTKFFNVSVTDVYDTGEGALSNWEALQFGLDPTNIYSNGYVDGSGHPLTNYQYVVAALGSMNVVTITATQPTAIIPATNPATSTGLITITRTSTLNAITVYLAVSGSGVAGTDYVGLPVACSFPIGVNTVTIPVVPLAGSIAPPATPIVVSIQPNAAYQVGASGSATVSLYHSPTTIAALTWTQRSDWLNVKTGSTLSTGTASLTGTTAYGDGIHDDTAAIQAAFNYFQINKYGPITTLYFPPGTYKISNTLALNGVMGFSLIGCGRNTTILWSGSAGGAMFNTSWVYNMRYIGLVWEGAGVASCAYEEAPINPTLGVGQGCATHENEQFQNFTVPGTYAYVSGSTMVTSPAPPAGGIVQLYSISGLWIYNCEFYNCNTGVIEAWNVGNELVWQYDGCEFDNCGTGINLGYSASNEIENCHFNQSATIDICNATRAHVSHCTSEGSGSFFADAAFQELQLCIVEDCWVDNWKTSGAACTLYPAGLDTIFDCNFTNPPAGATGAITLPSNYWSKEGPTKLILSNNYAPSFTSGTGIISPSSPSYSVVCVPSGSMGSALTSATQTFLKTSWPQDSTNIIDVTKAPYSANNKFGADATSAIQNAINAAASGSNSGCIVYLPAGKYKISSTLQVSGSNFTIQGSGYLTELCWWGSVSGSNGGDISSGTMMSISSPQNLAITQIKLGVLNNVSGTTGYNGAYPNCDPTTVTGISVTSNRSCSIKFDEIYYFSDYGSNVGGMYPNQFGPGLVLSSLPAGSTVFMGHVRTPLVVTNCGGAQIFGRYLEEGAVSVSGTSPKTGFLGLDFAVINALGSSAMLAPNIFITDNQDFIIGSYYSEQNGNDLSMACGNGVGTGRVTLGKMNSASGNGGQVAGPPTTEINVNNYAGRLFDLGGVSVDEFGLDNIQITQTGTNAVDIILAGSELWLGVSASTSAAANLIETQNWVMGMSGGHPNGVLTSFGNIPTAANLTSMAQGFDHLRQLEAQDLQIMYGFGNVVVNPSAGLDAVNPSPLTTPSYAPAAWLQSGTMVGSSGVRNVTVTGTASPFGPGSNSFYVLDTTGTSAGSRLQFSQVTPVLSATQAAVFSFDFNLDPTATGNDLWLRVYAGANACCYVHLTQGNLSAFINGKDTLLAAVTPGAWYRVQVFLQPPGNGQSNATLQLRQWTGSGPSSAVAYTIDGVPTISTGLNQIYINSPSPGQNIKIYLDNITLTSEFSN